MLWVGALALVSVIMTQPVPPVQLPSSPAQYQSATAALMRGDCGATIQLPDGRLLWIGSDATLPGHRGEFAHQVFLIEERPGSAASLRLLPGRPDVQLHVRYQQVPDWPDGTVFWPAAGAVEDGTLYLLGSRVRITGKGMWTWRATGQYEALFTWPDLRFDYIQPIPELSQWGSIAPGFLGGWWVVGTRRTTPAWTASRTGDVAWVPPGALGQPGAWQIRRSVLPCSLRLGTVVSLMPGGPEGWTAVTKQDDIMGQAIIRLAAPSPLGPWHVTGTWPVPCLAYSAQAHPGEPTPADTMLVSYAEGARLHFMLMPLT